VEEPKNLLIFVARENCWQNGIAHICWHDLLLARYSLPVGLKQESAALGGQSAGEVFNRWGHCASEPR